MAARSIWSGSISFGLVNVPVKLFSSKNEKGVKFHQINGKTGNRIQQKRVDAGTGKEVAYEELLKGYEITPERYVVITPEELDAVAPKRTKMIGLESFALADDLDPLTFDASYYVGPADTTAGTGKAFRLLVSAMIRENKVGIGRFVMRTKERLAALRVTDDGHLVLTTLVFADEVIDPERVVGEVEAEASDAELDMAQALIGSLTQPWNHAAYRDEYREAVLAMVQKKAAGEKIEAPTEDAPAAAPDLMAALAASLQAQTGDGAPKAKPKPAKKAPAKRTTRKKVAA